MYYSYIEIEYVATSFSPARTDLALKLLKPIKTFCLCIEGTHMTCSDKVAGSRKVLTTAMDDGQEFLIALAPSTSLHP
jgi:hypothetical protein